MKKILFFALAAFAFVPVKAQVPKKVSTPLIYVITGTWDGSFGSWGWKLAHDLITDTKNKALFVCLYPSSDSSYDNHKFYTSTSEDLAYMFGLGCYPSFGCNGEDKTGGSRDRNVIQKNVMDVVNGFVRQTPIVSCANSMKNYGF